MKNYKAKITTFLLVALCFLAGNIMGSFLAWIKSSHNQRFELFSDKTEVKRLLESFYKEWAKTNKKDLFTEYRRYLEKTNLKEQTGKHSDSHRQGGSKISRGRFESFFEKGVEPIHAIYHFQGVWFEAIAQLDRSPCVGRWILTKNGYIMQAFRGCVAPYFCDDVDWGKVLEWRNQRINSS